MNRNASRLVLLVLGFLAMAKASACAVHGFIGNDLSTDAIAEIPTDAPNDRAIPQDALGPQDASPDRLETVEGEYLLTLRTGKNECGLTPWDDASTLNVPVSVSQNGTEIRATLRDLVGLPTVLLLGSNEYRGTLDGNRLTLRIDGSVVGTQAACTFVYDGVIDGRYVEGGLSGDVRYVRAFRGGDCTGLACESQQFFDGVRAPKDASAD